MSLLLVTINKEVVVNKVVPPNFHTPFLIEADILKATNALGIKSKTPSDKPPTIDVILESFAEDGVYAPYEGEEILLTIEGDADATQRLRETGEYKIK